MLQLQIGELLSNSLDPTVISEIGGVCARLAKIVFNELKSRGFENDALERLARRLVYALEPFAEASLADGEYNSNYTSDDDGNSADEEHDAIVEEKPAC